MSRTSRAEFVVSVNRYLEAQDHKFSVGMRFKMRFEGEEVPERRYFHNMIVLGLRGYDLAEICLDFWSSSNKLIMVNWLLTFFYRFSGTIIGVGETKSCRWPNSKWRNLKVIILTIMFLQLFHPHVVAIICVLCYFYLLGK